MGASREVVVVSGVRTAIGDYGGSLKDFPLVDLAASVVADAIKRAEVDASKKGVDGRERPRRKVCGQSTCSPLGS